MLTLIETHLYPMLKVCLALVKTKQSALYGRWVLNCYIFQIGPLLLGYETNMYISHHHYYLMSSYNFVYVDFNNLVNYMTKAIHFCKEEKYILIWRPLQRVELLTSLQHAFNIGSTYSRHSSLLRGQIVSMARNNCGPL